MPYLQLDGQRIALEIGEVTIGSSPEAGVKVAGAGQAAAILRVGPDLQSSVRRSGESVIRVNGVQLGAEPTPLIHGDKIEIGTAELFFGDDRMGGALSTSRRRTCRRVLAPVRGRPGEPTRPAVVWCRSSTDVNTRFRPLGWSSGGTPPATSSFRRRRFPAGTRRSRPRARATSSRTPAPTAFSSMASGSPQHRHWVVATSFVSAMRIFASTRI